MDILEAIEKRHSVRSYEDKEISEDIINTLQKEIEKCNREGDLSFELFTEEPEAFNSFLARYGKFRNVKNYIVLAGKDFADLDEKVGYYGEHIALVVQQLGLNTCWVALTFKKRKINKIIAKDDRLVCVLALGYGTTQGSYHKSKVLEDVCSTGNSDMPDWFKKGVSSALLAPTAINQQKFFFTLLEDKVKADITGGINSKVDLGIVKYHFEVAAGKGNFTWV